MRQNEVQPILDGLFLRLGECLAQIRFDALFAVSTFKKTHAELTLQTEVLLKQKFATGSEVCFRSMYGAVSATDVRGVDPVWIRIGDRRAQDEDFSEMLIDNLNKQLLWLLVQTYEAVENFYKDFYGALGFLDQNLLSCSDFGNVRIPELSTLSLDWYQEQVRRTIGRHNVDGIINNIRKTFPAFKEAETKQVDLGLWLDAAAFFRHMIVHGQACIPEADLITSLTKATGHSFAGSDQSVIMRKWSMVSHFELHKGTYSLWLIDRKRVKKPYTFLEERFDGLMHNLASHVSLAYAVALSHFGQQPVWERQKETAIDAQN